MYRGKWAEARFERDCLTEYAQTFKTVCVDAGYYRIPSPAYLDGLAGQVPSDFIFTFKVTDEFTIKRFPQLARHGDRAGTANENFLNEELFQTAFLPQFETVRSKLGVLILEFSRFHASDFQSGREFVDRLSAFLVKLPKGWRYAVELRNKHWLKPEYFAVLREHGVAHVFNSWEGSLPISEQMAMPDALTADFTVARFLLKPGRKYEEAVKLFEPYDRIKEPNEDARRAGRALIQEGVKRGKDKPSYIYVNNRLEGSAPHSIAAMMEVVV